jgi:hypothetical protein
MAYIKINSKALKETLESTNISIAVMSVGALGHAKGYIYDAMRRGTMLEDELKKLAAIYGFNIKDVTIPEAEQEPKKEIKEDSNVDNVLANMIGLYKIQRESLAVEKEINAKLSEVINRLNAINNTGRTIAERVINE